MPSKRARWIAAGVALIGIVLTLLMMAHSERLPRGVLFGAGSLGLGLAGLFYVLGIISPLTASVEALDNETKAWWERPAIALLVSAAIAVVGALIGGYPVLPYVIIIALLALLPAGWSNPGLLALTILGFVYLPSLGTFGLWDPWETHYGEVAREILARDDWISLWWCQDHWFWSKPILIFWSEALSMSALGVDYLPGANPPEPEWAIRVPIVVMAFGALTLVYHALRETFSKHAAFLGVLVLGTMPHFFMIAHQAITDMPFVANMTMAICCFMLALRSEPEDEVRPRKFFRWQFSGNALLLAVLFAVVLPQALYLISRNFTFYSGLGPEGTFGFSPHGDSFVFGSAGNGQVEGNPAPSDHMPFARDWWFQPAAQGVFWLALLAVLVWRLVRERRRRALWMHGFYVFCGFAFMGKGIPGFALPGLVALLFLIGSRRWALLVNGHFFVARGIVTVLCVGMPWYLAMYLRHGPPFTDRLLIHDHINRLASGVHGDKGSVQYFIEQMGVGMFPWFGLLPIALAAFLWFRSRDERRLLLSQDGSANVFEVDESYAPSDDSARCADQFEITMLVGLWSTAAFVLFSAMITKFHHYIFPTVPPAAMLVAIGLARAFPVAKGVSFGPVRNMGRISMLLAGLAAACAALALGAWRGNLRGVIPEDVPQETRHLWIFANSEPTWVILLFAGLTATFALGGWWLERMLDDEGATKGTESRALLAFRLLFFATGAAVTAIVARDLSWFTDARPDGHERLIHLFVYNYERTWPTQFDYRSVLWGLAVAVVLVLIACAMWRRGRLALGALLGLSLAFSAWALNVYIPDLSPHWGQRELVKRYYEQRKNASEPLIAWQMNWKGENFYTGNRIHVFQKLDNIAVKRWIKEHPNQRAFFILEHSRLGGFRSLVRGGEIKEASDKRLNNKFVLLDVTLPGPPEPKSEPKEDKPKDDEEPPS